MIKKVIENTINRVIKETQGGMQTNYRAPLVGFARADDPLFEHLKIAVGPGHLLPSDLLPEAETVAAFFLPFTKELADDNRKDPYIARSWAKAYIETNGLISRCCEEINGELDLLGVKTAWQQPTHNFDPVELCSFWSHRHVAFICGLGEFGLNQMLITPSGCAGRLGSLVIDAPLEAAPPTEIDPCLYFRNGSCQICVKKCPTGALTSKGLDKQKCYAYLLEAGSHFSDLEGLSDVCGKCVTCGPCAVIE